MLTLLRAYQRLLTFDMNPVEQGLAPAEHSALFWQGGYCEVTHMFFRGKFHINEDYTEDSTWFGGEQPV